MQRHGPGGTAPPYREEVAILDAATEWDLARFAIVGSYVRFDEAVRNTLAGLRLRIAASFDRPGGSHANFLLWGPPGSGKSYLVQQIATILPPAVRFVEINLSKSDETAVRETLGRLEESAEPTLVLVDEVDAQSSQTWPYEMLLPSLEPARPRACATAFVLAGSSGGSVAELKERIARRSKGVDLLSRVPRGNEFEVPPLTAGDKMVVAAAQLVAAATVGRRRVEQIEKLALFFIASEPTLDSARQLRAITEECAARLPLTADRIRYDDLFWSGDPSNKSFWLTSSAFHPVLLNHFVRLRPATSPPAVGPTPAPPGSGGEVGRVDPKSRVAVLPMANISPDPHDEFFADGLTEELINALSRIKGLGIIARTSVGRYKSTSKTAGEIGRELGVGTILEGSVRKSDKTLRITLQLIDATSNQPRWAQAFDLTLDKVFSVQEEVAELTAAALQLELLQHPPQARRREPARNVAAYESYLQGVSSSRRLGPKAIAQARKYFETTIERDPSFSAAYSSLANLLISASGEHLPSAETLPQARELIARALALDPEDSVAHEASGNLAMQADLDWAKADVELKRAMTLNPNNTSARSWYGLLLVVLQRFDEASVQLEWAAGLDPESSAAAVWLAVIDYLTGNLDGCVHRAKKYLRRFPEWRTPYVLLAAAHLQAGRLGEASQALDLAVGTYGLPEVFRVCLLPRVGRGEEARRILADWRSGSNAGSVTAGDIGALHAALGERTEALDLLERDLREGERSLWYSYQLDCYDPIRSEPRFEALLRRYRLPMTPPVRLGRPT